MNNSYDNLTLETRVRDILKGLGLTPCTASVNYVTGEIAELIQYAINLSVEELKTRGLLRGIKKKTASLQYPPAVIYL